MQDVRETWKAVSSSFKDIEEFIQMILYIINTFNTVKVSWKSINSQKC